MSVQVLPPELLLSANINCSCTPQVLEGDILWSLGNELLLILKFPLMSAVNSLQSQELFPCRHLRRFRAFLLRSSHFFCL